VSPHVYPEGFYTDWAPEERNAYFAAEAAKWLAEREAAEKAAAGRARP
jgi:hypothetical protein